MVNVISGSGNIISIISISLLLIFIIASTLQGMRRGWKKQLLHTVSILEALLFSFIVVKGTTTAMLNAISAENIGELLSSMGTGINADVAEYISSIKWIVALPITTIIAPFALVFFFTLAIIFSGIMYNVTRRLLELTGKPGSWNERFIGMPIGAVEGLLVCSLFMLPMAGMFGLFDDGVNAVRSNSSKETSEFIEFYDANIEPVANNIAFKTARAFGGDAILGALATLEDGETKINLRNEIVPAVSIAVQASSLDSNAKSIDDDDKETLNKVIDTLEDSDYLTLLLSQTLNGMASAVKNGIVPLEIDPPFDKLMNSVIALFATSNKNNVVGDIRSLTDVYYILCDDGVLLAIFYGDSDALVDIFITRDENGDTVVNKVVEKLRANPHTEPLVSTLTELSVVLISSHMNIGDDSAEVYEDVKAGLRDVLTIKPTDYPDTEEGHELYLQDMTASLDETFRNNGIELEPEVTRGIAEYIDTEMEIKDEYTDAELDSIILSYYDAYLDYVESGEIPDDLKDKIPGSGDNADDDGEQGVISGPLEIKVVDTNGYPVYGVRLQVTSGGTISFPITDYLGTVPSDNLDSSAEIKVLQANGYNFNRNAVYTFKSNVLTITLTPETGDTETFTVYVYDENGNPVSGKAVYLSNDLVQLSPVFTDRDGKAVITAETGLWAVKVEGYFQNFFFDEYNVAYITLN